MSRKHEALLPPPSPSCDSLGHPAAGRKTRYLTCAHSSRARRSAL